MYEAFLEINMDALLGIFVTKKCKLFFGSVYIIETKCYILNLGQRFARSGGCL